MPRGVDEIELVDLAVVGLVIKGHTLCLDCNTSLALNVHGVEHLLVHLARTQASTMLDKPVCQRGLAMVNMGNNGKVADVAEITHSIGLGWHGRDFMLALGGKYQGRPVLASP